MSPLILAFALVMTFGVALAAILYRQRGVASLVPSSLRGTTRNRQPDLGTRPLQFVGQRGSLTTTDRSIAWVPDQRWTSRARSMSWNVDEVLSIDPWRFYIVPGLSVRLRDGGRCAFVLLGRESRGEVLSWWAQTSDAVRGPK